MSSAVITSVGITFMDVTLKVIDLTFKLSGFFKIDPYELRTQDELSSVSIVPLLI
jgi:hypothetical protein